MTLPYSFDSLFSPKTVAVIGASSDPRKIGAKVVTNMQAGGYPGRILPINPKGGEIFGLPAYKSLDEVDVSIDMACLVIPAKFVIPAVEQCGQKGVKFLLIITSGFSEIGNLKDEQEIIRIAQKYGMRVLGPNIFGIYSSASPVNATFGPAEVPRGDVAIITQSGALGVSMMGKMKMEAIGLSAVVSVGNKADVDEADLLTYLVDDPNTAVILMYIEGIKQGNKLVEILPQATRKKPVIVIKSGRSKRGAMAAASHTGSLAGADEIFDAIMKQCGVLRAESIQDAVDWCKFLSFSPAPKGEKAVIITNGGGIGVLASDACEKYNVDLLDDLGTLKDAFSGAVPEFGSYKNPIDITGQGGIKEYVDSVNAAKADPAIDSVIVLGCETALISGKALAGTVEKTLDRPPEKPIVYSFFGGQGIEEVTTEMRGQGVPIYGDVYAAVSCMGAAYRNARNRAKVQGDLGVLDRLADSFDTRTIEAVIKQVRADHRQFLLAHEATLLAKAAGLVVPESVVARNLDQAVAAAESIGWPVVMKIVSRDILHKSDAGGIALDLRNVGEVVDAYEAILHNAKRHDSKAVITGIEVAEQVKSGTETIMGARRDGSFGPILMFGLGGIYVEVLKDVAFRALPLSENEARSMIREIKSAPLLWGVRGEKRKDIDSILDSLMRVGALLYRYEDIADIEINPLMVYEQGAGAKAVDLRILLGAGDKGDQG
jgi:acetate---CoA ligase (ADP-forming)